jgi:antitoxin (DNA-binding transcriptional repressor) of toxin-antitoxin stability system
MPLTPSQLRADIYRLLDRILETGVPLEIDRRGKTLLIVAAQAPGRLDRLPSRPTFINGDPDDLVHLDWSREWKP